MLRNDLQEMWYEGAEVQGSRTQLFEIIEEGGDGTEITSNRKEGNVWIRF